MGLLPHGQRRARPEPSAEPSVCLSAGCGHVQLCPGSGSARQRYSRGCSELALAGWPTALSPPGEGKELRSSRTVCRELANAAVQALRVGLVRAPSL